MTANAGTRIAPKYKGYVHLIVGDKDKVFCGVGAQHTDPFPLGDGNCTPNGKNIPSE